MQIITENSALTREVYRLCTAYLDGMRIVHKSNGIWFLIVILFSFLITLLIVAEVDK